MLLVFLGGRREENGHSGQVPGLGQGNRAHQNISHCARGGHTGTVLYININKAQCMVNIYPGIQALTTVKERSGQMYTTLHTSHNVENGI
jgi:hypothetical protein